MSKNKQVSKKQATKNKFTLFTVVIVLIAFLAYFVTLYLFSPKEDVTSELDKAVNNNSTYSFLKQGELSFQNSNGDIISRLDVEVADDDAKRQRGLMFRDKMEQNQGMIFLFEKESPQAFWMHNTILPLDIIYVNANMEIVHIAKNAKPFDDTALPSVKPSKYVVEVNGGYTDKLNIKDGDKIVWRRL
jgi:uncharacterized protein